MIVHKDLKKTVAFLFYDKGEGQLATLGTGFFVSIQAEGESNLNFVYLVTAKHVIRDFDSVLVRLNKREYAPGQGLSGVEYFQVAGSQWIMHSDNSVDIAIVPWAPPLNKVDYKVIGLDMFGTKEVFQAHQVSEGDEVFFAGLLTQYYGSQRNYPVVRYGRIALIPEEKINTAEGAADCYLVECQSFPGNSGSPVFLWLSPTRTPGQIVVGGSGLFLMGVMKGYFPQAHEVLVGEVGAAKLISQENVGIALIVPTDKIKEILFYTKLVEQRDNALREFTGSKQVHS